MRTEAGGSGREPTDRFGRRHGGFEHAGPITEINRSTADDTPTEEFRRSHQPAEREHGVTERHEHARV